MCYDNMYCFILPYARWKNQNFSFLLHFEDSFLPLGASGSPQLGGFKLGSSAEVFSAKATGKHVAAQNGCNCIEFARCGSYYFVTLE